MKAKLSSENLEIEMEIPDEAVKELQNIGDKNAKLNLTIKKEKDKWKVNYISLSKQLDKFNTVSYNYDETDIQPVLISEVRPKKKSK
ncbi:MAG: hypothetical protein ACUVQP_04900 [Bacteroidales bacterium]